MGHAKIKQQSLFKNHLSTQYGGELRKRRSGRGSRPLSGKDPLHLVFKINKFRLRSCSLRSSRNFQLINFIIKKYSGRFAVKIEQLSVQNDHIHLLVRAPRRYNFHYFHRVLAGQVAQIFTREGLLKSVTDTPARGTGLWKYRPFSRVVKGWKAYRIARNYIQLNEMEVLGLIPYRPQRLKGLSSAEWEALWR